MRNLTYTPSPGTSIDNSVLATSRMARELGRRVRFDFNGITLEATPKKSPVTLLWEWQRILGQRAATYRLSKAGQTSRDERQQEIARNQDAVSAAIKTLPGLLHGKNMDHLMGWLKSFAYCADDVGVDINKAAGLKGGAFEWLAVVFEANGYKENDLVGDEPESFNTRDRIGRYIAGQAINCFRRGMPPHPVTQSFVDKYFATPDGAHGVTRPT